MIRINLLPHREQKKALHRRRFQWLCAVTATVVIALLSLSNSLISYFLTQQEQRNQWLNQQITLLDHEIKSIGALKKQRDELLARKQLVESLERDRSEAVHIFDQLIHQTPDGIYLNSFKQVGNQFTLSGYAISGSRVSTFMRNLGQSTIFDSPVLVEVKAEIVNDQRLNEFTLTSNLRSPSEKNVGAKP